jgi:chromosomal replication initiation ATPase DnaA
MYLLKRCYDRRLWDIAEYFRSNGYATVSWNRRIVESKMPKETKFKDRIEKIGASITQL